jgi:hypothetical protein
MVYYLSKGVVGPELRYYHIKKLALVAVHTAQQLKYYILLQKINVLAYSNTMQHILTMRIIRDKYSKWTIILQKFDLESATSKFDIP